MGMKRRLYLAYGSNMNLEQMARRCPTAVVVGHTMLENWKLVFNGVASVERSKGDRVPVVVWDIKPDDEAALDLYEGWPRLYRKETRRIRLDGKLANAMIYIMNNVRRYAPPSAGYYNVILEGYKSAGFDTKTLCKAAGRTERKDGFYECRN
ncbi:MAG: gamma-glutamylcyclotransferase [Defluviitaleaceae bacterium]|nr:gamma-glutamylcyclotransferase [Defluviitaleaceae bacterium]